MLPAKNDRGPRDQWLQGGRQCPAAKRRRAFAARQSAAVSLLGSSPIARIGGIGRAKIERRNFEGNDKFKWLNGSSVLPSFMAKSTCQRHRLRDGTKVRDPLVKGNTRGRRDRNGTETSLRAFRKCFLECKTIVEGLTSLIIRGASVPLDGELGRG